MTLWPQPMVVVTDVAKSSRWYQQVLGVRSNHGGSRYEQLCDDDELVLQLHSRDGDAVHGPLADPHAVVGNGVAMWFEMSDLDAALTRVDSCGAEVEWPVHINPDAHQREVWLRDPDGYRVVLAGESEFRPRS